MTVSNLIGDNNPPVDHAAIIAANAPAAARDLSRGNIRLRLMATSLLNRVMAGASFNGEKVNAERAAGIEKGSRIVKPTVDGETYVLTADESAKVKQAFATMFSHVAFWEGELTADTVADDADAYRGDILSGTVALSTAYKAISDKRRKDAKAKAEAEAKAEGEAAAASLTETGELLPVEDTTVADAIAAMQLAMEAIAKVPAPFGDAFADAFAALDVIMVDAMTRHNEATAAPELETAAA